MKSGHERARARAPACVSHRRRVLLGGRARRLDEIRRVFAVIHFLGRFVAFISFSERYSISRSIDGVVSRSRFSLFRAGSPSTHAY